MTADDIYAHLQRTYHGVSLEKSWISRITDGIYLTTEQVYNTWLMTDLSETNASQLPGDILDKTKFDVVDVLTLQVLSVVNVGSSMYSQLKTLSGRELPEDDFTQNTQFNRNPPASRLLFLELTDGANIISAMEYRPCPQLSTNIPPGTKMVVSRPTSRIGVILLEPGNFTILGGCVEELKRKNSQKNLLSAALDNDYVEDDDDGPVAVPPNNPHRPAHRDANQQNVPLPASHKSNAPISQQQIMPQVRQNQNATNVSNDNSRTSAKRAKTVPDIVIPVTNTTASNSRTDVENFSEFLDDLTAEFFEDVDVNVDDPSSSKTTIKDLHPDLTTAVEIEATLIMLCTKLNSVPEWTVQCKLADFLDTKEFRLSEGVLVNTIGFTSTEFKQLQPVSKTNPSIKTYLRKGLENCQKELTYMTGKFTVQPNTLKSISNQCPYEINKFEKLDEENEKQLKDFVKAKYSNA